MKKKIKRKGVGWTDERSNSGGEIKKMKENKKGCRENAWKGEWVKGKRKHSNKMDVGTKNWTNKKEIKVGKN